MELGLNEQVAVVVGAARGLGHAIAAAFAAEGARVALLDVSPEVQAAATQLGGEGWVVDVTNYPAVKTAAEDVRFLLGRFDHVVFAAGIGSGKFGFPFWRLDPTDWLRVLNVNLVGAANVAHAFAPGLAEQRGGTMLFLASV
ncbi:MAG TPA: SDR family NAD(P)-dependent oxidoreductase, partial [Gemmataceae bacterium]|nr:SDR family NAD(P)-dependent oxidoreductase [Gemmataceae bacterium]